MEEGMKQCPRCAESVKAEAIVCRHCGYNFETGLGPDTHLIPEAPDAKKKFGCLRVGMFIAAGIILLAVIGSLLDDGYETSPAPIIKSNESQEFAGMAALESGNTDSLVGPQNNAARSARQYLSMTGFSRKGLIDQLSSSAGDGYNVADATVAVDSLGVDWNEQAVRSAQQYIKMTGFSCQGLVDQLSSSAGEQYTESEATYGATQAGAC